MAQKIATEASGLPGGLARFSSLKLETFEERRCKVDATLGASENDSTPLYKYQTPSEWRRLHRGQDSKVLVAKIKPFPFLMFPAELRNTIYRELLLTTIPLQLMHNRPSWPDIDNPGKAIHPAILRTSRQVHNEAAAILYGENTWYLSMAEPLADIQAATTRLNPSFTLAPPLTTYMSRIRRITMHAGSTDYLQTNFELHREMRSVGIVMEKLQLLAIQFPDQWALERHRVANADWLEEADVGVLKEKYVWFPEGVMLSEDWLVMKQEKRDDAGLGRIPGLGVC